MAQKSKPKTSKKSSYYHFEGIDTRKTHSGKESIANIKNFRLREDGSLEKRCGFKPMFNTSEKIRRATVRVIDGIEHYYFVSGKTVYTKTIDQEPIIIGNMYEEGKNVYFFEYLGQLYLCNGEKFYLVGENLSEADTYVPIYGKDWSGTTPGEQYEELNLLTNMVMITYKLADNPTGYLSLGGLKLLELVSLYKNGIELAKEEYTYDNVYDLIYFQQASGGDELVAVIKFQPTEEYLNQRAELLEMRASSVFYELNNNNLFLWGSPSNNKVYYSSNKYEENFKFSESYVPKTGKFYMPLNAFFSVGSKHDRINAMIRHYDRVMLMTNSSTWITDPESLDSKDFKIKNINASIGCSIANGAIRVENTLISIGENSIYSWTSDTDELNECNAYSISEPIKNLLPQYFFNTCSVTINQRRKEIWFHSLLSSEVWIYNLSQKAWYCFNNFSPDFLFENTSEIGFVKNNYAYIFDENQNIDQANAYQSEISPEFVSGELEFNDCKRKKLQSVSLRGEMSDGEITVSVILDNKTTLTNTIKLSGTHTVIPFRFKSSGFYSLIFKLQTTGRGKHIIHGIELNAK